MRTVLVPHSYGLNFNVSQAHADQIRRTRYAPLYRLWGPLESFALYWPFQSGEVLHSFNAIPLLRAKPWVVTFESRLPRVFGGNAWLGRLLRERLLGSDCLAVIAMSQWAAALFEHYNRDWEQLPLLMRKLHVLHPTLPTRSCQVRTLRRGEPIRLAFVGNQFALKGGVTAVRLAKRAAEAGIPLELDVVSAMRYGKGNHLDFSDRRAYADDMRLLGSLPNVRFHGTCSNEFVLQLMERAHLSFLGSLHETYGFSVIEGFSCATPAMTSNVCALPEINDRSRGIILQLPTDDLNCWQGALHANSPDYWDFVNSTYDNLAEQALKAIHAVRERPEIIEELSLGAIEAASTRHNPATAAAVLNRIYPGAVGHECRV